MLVWAHGNGLPTSFSDMQPFKSYAVPFDYANMPCVEGCVVSAKTQVDWIGQCCQADFAHRFMLHIDGKSKLHVGKFTLVTVGTHVLSFASNRDITRSFRPLVYVMTKQRESEKVVALALKAILKICDMYFGGSKNFHPGAGAADHGRGIRAGWKQVYPDVPLAGCWPHIAWGMSHGKLLPKSHTRWEKVQLEFEQLHRAVSHGMWDVLVKALADEWGDNDAKLNGLWNEYLVGEGANWYIGFTRVPAAPPSQQAQEGWHQNSVMARLKGLLLAGMKKLLTESLPKLVKLDGKCTRVSMYARVSMYTRVYMQIHY